MVPCYVLGSVKLGIQNSSKYGTIYSNKIKESARLAASGYYIFYVVCARAIYNIDIDFLVNYCACYSYAEGWLSHFLTFIRKAAEQETDRAQRRRS